MESAIVILLLVIGAVGGSLVTYAWKSDGTTLIKMFREMERDSEQTEHSEAPL